MKHMAGSEGGIRMLNTPKIADICSRLGLSKATVSKALNGYDTVSEETRIRVLNCARELGYTQAGRAKDVNARLTRIGIMPVSVTGNPDGISIYQPILDSLLEILAKAHYDTVLIPPAILKDTSMSYEQAMHSLNLDCAMLTGLRLDDPYARQLQETEFPTVLWDMRVDNPHVHCVSCDSIEGMRMAVRHLLSLGHRRIGMICGHEQAQVSLQRRDGYILALAEKGIPYDPSLVYMGDFSEAAGVMGMTMLMEKNVTGVVCISDVTALGAWRAAQAMHIRIPEDISLIGYDNTNLTGYMTPGLTSVDQHPERIGQLIAVTIDSTIRGLPQGDSVILPSLVCRGSTAAPRGGEA